MNKAKYETETGLKTNPRCIDLDYQRIKMDLALYCTELYVFV